MFRKLRNRFIIWNMLITTLVMLLSFGAIYAITWQNIRSENASRLNNPNTVAFILTVDRDGNVLEIESSMNLPQEIYMQAARNMNRDVGRERPSGSGSRRPPRSRAMQIYGRTWIYQVSSGRNDQPQRISFVEITDSERTLEGLSFSILLVGLGMLLVIFLISWRYANRSIAPIAQAWEKQRQFVADASHELKTPLATMMANYDVVMANQETSVESQKEWLGYMEMGMERMNNLVASLLTLAKMEDGERLGEKQDFDFGILANGIMQSMEGMAQERNLNVNSNLEEGLRVHGYEALTGQLFTILYDNALKYTNEGGGVELRISREKRQLICKIRNTGKGIPKKDLPHVFDRFYRTDASRTVEEGGYGLGLAIAKSIAERIGAKLSVQSVENEWTEFVIVLNE